MAQAPETNYSAAEQITFELERLTLTDEHRLELAGRWFGVRGRRFVRPTLTLIGAHKRSRSLADLEHKPWPAEDGTSWFAVFPLHDPGEDVIELELAVAPDIAVLLSPPPELASLPRKRGPSSSAVLAPRTPPLPLRETALPESPANAAKPKPPARRAAAAHAQATIEQQQVSDAQSHRQALAEGKRENTERELAGALREREEARKGWKEAHQGRDAAVRERDQALAERDQALIERDQALAKRDRAADERDRLVDERDQTQTERLSTLRPRPAIGAPEHRPRVHESMRASRWVVWTTRLFALLVLIAIVAAILIIIRSA